MVRNCIFKFSKESDSITLEGDDFYNIFNEYLKQSRNLYNYFPSVLYLIGKDFWDEVQFRKEYDEFFKRYDKDLPWIKELEKFKDFRNFIDSEFDECLKNIISYIESNRYTINQLHFIAYHFEQYNNIGIVGDFKMCRISTIKLKHLWNTEKTQHWTEIIILIVQC